MGDIYHKTHKKKKAEEIYVERLETMKYHVGKTDMSTIEAMGALVDWYDEVKEPLKAEILRLEFRQVTLGEDSNIRQGSTQEKLDGLKLAFDQNGTVTAATSSPLTDGASATLICEEQFAKDNNLEILARIVSTSVQGCKADTMGLGPIGASQKA